MIHHGIVLPPQFVQLSLELSEFFLHFWNVPSVVGWFALAVALAPGGGGRTDWLLSLSPE
jgi:hypothetical protein